MQFCLITRSNVNNSTDEGLKALAKTSWTKLTTTTVFKQQISVSLNSDYNTTSTTQEIGNQLPKTHFKIAILVKGK